MRTSLGVLLAALAAGGCSLALDMDRFGRGGDEKIVMNDTNEPRSGKIEDRNAGGLDGGDAGAPPSSSEPAPANETEAGTTPAPACTIQEVEPNNVDSEAQTLGFGTLCGALSTDRDEDHYDFAGPAPSTLTIEGSQDVTIQVFRMGQIYATHQGSGQATQSLPPGGYEIWVHGIGPGVKAYRLTRK
jgi:hypothetical protein